MINNLFKPAFATRTQLKNSKRIVVKLGSAVITRENGQLSVPRISAIVEQIVDLYKQGKEVIIVTSGAVAAGRNELSNAHSSETADDKRVFAALGQLGLMSFYNTLFKLYDLKIAQVLVSELTFRDALSRKQLKKTMQGLLERKIVPIVNTNDAVEATLSSLIRNGQVDVIEADMQDIIVGDNDSVASCLAVELESDLMIILSNVDGVYSGPPDRAGSKLYSTFSSKTDFRNSIKFGTKSKVGFGGMESKIESAFWAVERGTSVVICNGSTGGQLKKIINGDLIGTFMTNSEDESKTADSASLARSGSEVLSTLSVQDRASIIIKLADLLEKCQDEIIFENQRDLVKAENEGLEKVLLSRLKLNSSKLNNLVVGLRQIAEKTLTDIDKTLRVTKVSETLRLEKITAPIGVLLVIFESRPDCLPQISALSIATGNGLLLKGGREAKHSNAFLYNLVLDALAEHKCQDAIQLIDTREGVSDLLKYEKNIDLIIPRGSSQLVKSIQKQARSIPVLAHSEGICHVYADAEVDYQSAIKIIVDSKCDYPSACNAMETLLIHRNLADDSKFMDDLLEELKKNGVVVNMGAKLAKLLSIEAFVSDYKVEYSCLEMTMELVDNVDEAIHHINEFGSKHTDVIITKNAINTAKFKKQVDSACVFINCSTRFADGFRFGLGAEVGISTSKIHARGPAGMESLLSYKWVLRGDGLDTVQSYEGTKQRNYLHENEL